ncbi:hypothetical protein ACX0G9_25810 [Flavitalea flava]
MNRKILIRLLPVCCCWLSIFLSLGLQGQILNIDKIDTSAYDHRTKTTFNLSSGLEIDKQNKTLYDATNTAEMMVQKYKELFIFAASYRFTYNGPDDILNAGYFHLRYRHGYKNKVQPEPFVQYQWDNKRGILSRALAGANVRYNFFKGDHFDLNCGLGLMYEYEKWNYAGVDTVKVPVHAVPIVNRLIKLNSFLRLDWKPNGNNDITFNVFLQTRPDRFQPRIAPHIRWDIKAGKHLGLSIIYTGLYDTRPVVPIDKFYYSLSNSILLSF